MRLCDSISAPKNVILWIIMKNDYFFKILRGERLSEEEAKSRDWNSLFREAARQSVLPLFFESAKVYKPVIPAEIYAAWQDRNFALFAANIRVVGCQNALLAHLKAWNEPYCILKGLSSARYWPKPELRPFGDCDFLVRREHTEAIAARLLENDYQKGSESGDHHICFRDSYGGHLEMHYRLNGIPEGKIGEIILDYLGDPLEGCESVKVSGANFRTPGPEIHAAVLILHMRRHLQNSGIGLRHLLDWGFFVTATQEADFWQASFLPFLKRVGLCRFARVVTKACALSCGTFCPAWAQEAEEELCLDLLEDMMESGNFGRKNPAKARSTAMISADGEHGKLYNLYRTLHSGTAARFPWVKKWKILYPLMDIYRVLHYLFLELRGKKASVLSMVPYADERRALYDRLRLFRPEK